MRRSPWLLWIGTWAMSIGAIGCANSGSSSDGPGLDLTVAPLDLPLATDACYQIKVWNAEDPVDGEVVWEQTALCASQYGANNGIRFTGICDADAPGGINSVRLILNDIYTGGTFETGTALTAGTDYINPCAVPGTGEDNGCVLTAQCDPNQDTKVEFNLTVMRQAQLGFFDTVVRLDDLFCAAKLDCVDQDLGTLEYLFDPAANADGPTAVLGFTCVGGTGNLFMYLDDLAITCTDGNNVVTRTATVDPSLGPGNITHTESNPNDPILFGAAVNIGDGFQSSRYWNVLLGTRFAGPDETCTLRTTGTASKTPLIGTPFETREHTRYPYIEWNVELSSGGARTCSQHPLNGGDVVTRYNDIDTPERFAHRLQVGEVSCDTDNDCLGTEVEVCNLATNTCSCIPDLDQDGLRESGCQSNHYCSNAATAPECVVGCATTDDCAPGSGCIDNVCVATNAFAAGPDPVEIVSADFNQDGHLDVAVSNYNRQRVNVLLGTGTGTLGAAVSYSTGSGTNFGLTSGDYNEDGDVDLAVSIWNGKVAVLLGAGDGTFQGPTQYNFPANSDVYQMKTADFDSDGNLDLAVCTAWGASIAVLYGDGDGTFPTATAYPTGGASLGTAIGDFNEDGHPDVMGTVSTSSALRFMAGSATGGLTASGPPINIGQSPRGVIFGGGSWPGALTSADLDNDGNLDAISVSPGGFFSIVFGNGNGTFDPFVQYLLVGAAENASAVFSGVGDFDDDGNLDILVTDNGRSAVSIFFGLGAGVFETAPWVVSMGAGAQTYGVTVGDFNEDGVDDWAVANAGSGTVSIGLGGF